MELNFPNRSRSYNAAQDCICFWGHVSQFEVAFQIGSDALQRIDSATERDEASLLQIFDRNLAQIQKVAGRAFSRRKQPLYRLAASEF